MQKVTGDIGVLLIPEILKILDIEVCENFLIEDRGRTFRCRFTASELQVFRNKLGTDESGWETCKIPFNTLCCVNIIRAPWLPARGEEYYTYDGPDWKIIKRIWEDNASELALQIQGCVFKTEREAEIAQKYKYRSLRMDWGVREDETIPRDPNHSGYVANIPGY